MSGIQSTIDILNNLDATSAPGASDDTTVGYSINSVWIDVTNKLVYTCVDATSGAAVWITGNATKDNLTASVDPTATDDSSAGYAVGSTWINTTANTDWRCVDATNGAAVWFKAEPANANIQAHIVDTSNPHSVTATQTGAAALTGAAFSGAVTVIAASTTGETTKAIRAQDVKHYAFTAGVKIPAYMSSAPTGWTQDTSLNDHMLTLVSGAGGTTAGTNGASTGVPATTTGSHTLTTTEMPAHTHSYTRGGVTINVGVNGFASIGGAAATTGSTGGNAGHTHTLTSWVPLIAKMILITKD